VNEVGADRVGIRVNPHNKFLDCIGSDPVTQHGYLLKELNKFNLAYVHCVEPRVLGKMGFDHTYRHSLCICCAFLFSCMRLRQPPSIEMGVEVAGRCFNLNVEFPEVGFCLSTSEVGFSLSTSEVGFCLSTSEVGFCLSTSEVGFCLSTSEVGFCLSTSEANSFSTSHR
jgi:hypothetical protein